MRQDLGGDLGPGSPQDSPRTAFSSLKDWVLYTGGGISRHLINAYGKKGWKEMVFQSLDRSRSAARGFCLGGPDTKVGGSDDAHGLRTPLGV